MKIYFAGMPADVGVSLESRERGLYKFLTNRLLSYFYILQLTEMWKVVKEIKECK